VRDSFGIVLPSGPYRAEAARVAFAGTGAGVWLATQDRGGSDFTAALEECVGATAAVSDQSDGLAVLRLTGPMLRNALAKIIPLDLHSRAFAVGGVASTLASHMGVTLWRLPDAGDGSPVIDIAVFRSLAFAFWHALAQSAAEFGLILAPSG
jgi:sarcosine oxidase subunit gamma